MDRLQSPLQMDGSPSCFVFFSLWFCCFCFSLRSNSKRNRAKAASSAYISMYTEKTKCVQWSWETFLLTGLLRMRYFSLFPFAWASSGPLHTYSATLLQSLTLLLLRAFFPFLVHIHVHHDGWWADLRMMLELPLKSLMDAALILGTLFTVSFILFVLQTFQNTLSRIKAKIRQNNIAFPYSFLAWLS